jgi:hypothetical protein
LFLSCLFPRLTSSTLPLPAGCSNNPISFFLRTSAPASTPPRRLCSFPPFLSPPSSRSKNPKPYPPRASTGPADRRRAPLRVSSSSPSSVFLSRFSVRGRRAGPFVDFPRDSASRASAVRWNGPIRYGARASLRFFPGCFFLRKLIGSCSGCSGVGSIPLFWSSRQDKMLFYFAFVPFDECSLFTWLSVRSRYLRLFCLGSMD